MMELLFLLWAACLYFVVMLTVLTNRRSLEPNGEITPVDAWISLLWPVWLVVGMMKALVYCCNEVIVIILLLIWIDYRKTKLYSYIERVF